MKRASSGLVALWILFSLILELCGGTVVWAADGAVRGRIVVEGGTLPQGSLVKATPLDGGAPSVTPVAPDGTYQFPRLAEGAYLFEVTDPGGAVLGTGTRTLVPPGALQLNLRANVQPVAVPTPPSDVPPEPPKPPRPPKDATWSAKKWSVVGIIVGGLAVGVAAGNDDGSSGSPSTP